VLGTLGKQHWDPISCWQAGSYALRLPQGWGAQGEAAELIKFPKGAQEKAIILIRSKSL